MSHVMYQCDMSCIHVTFNVFRSHSNSQAISFYKSEYCRNRGMEKGRSRSRNRDRSRSRDKGRNRGEKCKSEWRIEQEAIDLLKQKGYTIYKSKATKEELCTARRTVNDIINTARKELSSKLKSDLPEHANLNKKIEEDPYNYVPGIMIFKALRTPSRNDGEPCPLYNCLLYTSPSPRDS